MRKAFSPLLATLTGAFVLFGSPHAVAQDPIKVAPDMYKVAVDNDQVRVLDITLKAGGKSPMHSHPGYVAVALTPCKMRFTASDGKTTEAEFKAGDVFWRDAESHSGQNIGNVDCHVLNIESKASLTKGK